jgi:hypothetical protein
MVHDNKINFFTNKLRTVNLIFHNGSLVAINKFIEYITTNNHKRFTYMLSRSESVSSNLLTFCSQKIVPALNDLSTGNRMLT